MKNILCQVALEYRLIFRTRAIAYRILFFGIFSLALALLFSRIATPNAATGWLALFVSTFNLVYAPFMFAWRKEQGRVPGKSGSPEFIIRSKTWLLMLSNLAGLLVVSPFIIFHLSEVFTGWLLSVICFNIFVHSWLSTYLALFNRKNINTGAERIYYSNYNFLIQAIPLVFLILIGFIAESPWFLDFIYLFMVLLALGSLLLSRQWMRLIVGRYMKVPDQVESRL